MLRVLAKATLAIVFTDLAIGFIWIGLIGFKEMRDTYNQVFPNGLERMKKWVKK